MLIIDTPESCAKCKLRYDSYGECDICAGKDLIVDDFIETNTKPDWCPLSSLPERINLKQYVENGVQDIGNMLAYQYAQGWNDCLEDIQKGRN